MIRRAWALLLCGLLVAAAPAKAEEKVFSDKAFEKEIQQARFFEQKHQFKKAGSVYHGLLKKKNLSKSQRSRLWMQLENLSIRMIFSKIKIPGSVLYSVQEGDSLVAIAKKFHTTVDLIRKSNSLDKKDPIRKGMQLKIMTGTFKVRVDKSDNVLSLYYEDKPLKHYRVTTGSKNKTPVGKFKIVTKVKDPTWYWQDKAIPPGDKKNLIGTRWMGFDKPSYGIHGTVEPQAIGKQASLGCVRMLNRDVEELYTLIPIGTRVTIVD